MRSEPDAGDTVTWTLTGADAALFSIDPVSGIVTLNAAQDFGAPGDANADGVYEITVRATDSGGLFNERNVQLALTQAPAPAQPSIAMPVLPAAEPTPLPLAPSAPVSLPTLSEAPVRQTLAERALGLAVDAGVAPADLANIGLSGLPPTSAVGPASFGLTHLSREQASTFLFAESALPQETGGHRLFVYHGMPGVRPFGDGATLLRVPADAFAHTDPKALVHLEARLEDGLPLPGWLRFEGVRGVFTAIPPAGAEERLDIEIVARDTEGREARVHVTLEMDVLRTAAAAAGIALGMDVDKEEAEKARREAARQTAERQPAGKPGSATAGVRAVKGGAASFSDQISAAKTQRDPLLDQITTPDKVIPRGRR
jgi:hypothetical protein